MKRLGIGIGIAGLLVLVAACSDDTVTPTPGVAGAGSATGGSPGAGAPSGGSIGAAGAPTAGGTAAGAGGTAAGAGGTGGGGAGGSAGMAGGAGGSAGAGGSGGAGGTGGGSCDTKPGKALKLDGGKIDILSANLGDLPGGNTSRTIELWAKFTGTSSWEPEHSMIETGKHVTAGNQILGIDLSGRASATQGLLGPYTNGFSDNNGDKGVVVDAAPDVGWLHLAWSFDTDTGLSFTVNGVQKPVQMGGQKLTLDLTPGILTLGASQNFGPVEGWSGVMDEVKVWSVSKTPADVLANMRVIPKASTPGLVAYYRFNTDANNEASDEAKKAAHTLKQCGAKNDICPATNNAAPTWVASDIPGPFTCAP